MIIKVRERERERERKRERRSNRASPVVTRRNRRIIIETAKKEKNESEWSVTQGIERWRGWTPSNEEHILGSMLRYE